MVSHPAASVARPACEAFAHTPSALGSVGETLEELLRVAVREPVPVADELPVTVDELLRVAVLEPEPVADELPVPVGELLVVPVSEPVPDALLVTLDDNVPVCEPVLLRLRVAVVLGVGIERLGGLQGSATPPMPNDISTAI